MQRVSITLCSNSGSCENSRIIPENFNTARFTNPIASHIQPDNKANLAEIQSFIDQNKNLYLAGFMGYSVGEKLLGINNSLYQPMSNFPSIGLWAFQDVRFSNEKNIHDIKVEDVTTPKTKLHALTSKSSYLKKVGELKEHIQLGDIYEINYCIGFEAEGVDINPTEVWDRLLSVSPMPFSALLDCDDFAIISASPERFIHKVEDRVFCQPMKGTLAKSSLPKEESINRLKYNAKERSENVMIVDLTRNDLSKIAEPDTVHVDELFGVYEFQTIFQMISTVSARLNPGNQFTDIIKATFPMGSMTGAPKKKAMELIQHYEDFSRGVFSGSLGYISPMGNADFNVLIRTIFYDKKEKKLFIAAGSAITSGSDPEKEYEECLIKLRPLLQAIHAEI